MFAMRFLAILVFVDLSYSVYCHFLQRHWVNWAHMAHEHWNILYNSIARVCASVVTVTHDFFITAILFSSHIVSLCLLTVIILKQFRYMAWFQQHNFFFAGWFNLFLSMVVKYLLRIESFPSTIPIAYINFTRVHEKCEMYKPWVALGIKWNSL